MPFTVKRSVTEAHSCTAASTLLGPVVGQHEKLRENKISSEKCIFSAGVWFWAAIAATIPFFFPLGLPSQTWLIFYLMAFLVGSSLVNAERKIAKTKALTTMQENSLWHGASGTYIMLFGVVLQSVLSVVVAFGLAEWFQGIFAPFAPVSLLVPVGNFLSWQAIREKKQSALLLRRFISGLSSVTQLVCFACVSMISFSSCFWVVAFVLPLLVITLALNHKLWSESSSACSRKDRTISVMAVALASLICFSQTSNKVCDWLAAVSFSSPDAPIRSSAFKQLQIDDGQRSVAESMALKDQVVSLYTAEICTSVSQDPAVISEQGQQVMPSVAMQSRRMQAAHLRALELKRRHRRDRALRRRNGEANANAGANLPASVARGDGRLHGASSGTIPVGDNTFITGVNTAGTVRINNLAVLETVLNIVANGCEIIFLAWGVPSIIVGLLQIKTGAGRLRMVLGLAFALIGLSVPGIINWLVASTRDGSGFS